MNQLKCSSLRPVQRAGAEVSFEANHTSYQAEHILSPTICGETDPYCTICQQLNHTEIPQRVAVPADAIVTGETTTVDGVPCSVFLSVNSTNGSCTRFFVSEQSGLLLMSEVNYTETGQTNITHEVHNFGNLQLGRPNITIASECWKSH